MKNFFITSTLILTLLAGTTLHGVAQTKQEIQNIQQELKQLTAADKMVQQHLTKFDTLDYTVFSNQKWARMHESHAANIKVFWPDGHQTVGLARHIADMEALFVYAPDTRI